jgi:hypothetical protein
MKNLLLLILFSLKLFVVNGQSKIEFARPTLFETAFLNDPTLIDSTVSGGFLKIRLGLLKIESGKLVIADPVHIHHAPIIPYTFPIGNFPAEIAVNYIDSSELDSLAYVSYSRIVFSLEKVTKWILLVDAKKDSAFKNQTNYSAWTESCVILDKNARQVLIGRPYVEWAKLFVDSLNDNNRYRKWKLEKFRNHNLITYSGFDSFMFRVYLGVDANGKIARLLVDGGMFALPPSFY